LKVPEGNVSFSYEDAKIHKFGKGFLGFAKTTSINIVNDLKTVNKYDYNKTFFNTYLEYTHTMLASNNKSEIQKMTYTNKAHDFGYKIILPYTEKIVKEDLLNDTNIVDSLAYDFANGNLKYHETQYVNVSKSDGGGVLKTTIYTETVKYTYQKRPNASYESLLTKLETTGKHYDDGTKLYNRHIICGYDSKGNLKRRVTDNGVIAHYILNGFGLATTKIDTIPDIGVITTNFEYDGMYRFVIKSTNPAIGSVKTNYNILGKLKNETDINNLTTSYKYDRLGRLTETHTSEGHVIKTSQHWAKDDPTAPQNAMSYVDINVPGRPNTRTYYDILGREIRSRTVGFDNKNIFVDKTYNAKGQLQSVSDPYYTNETKKYTTYEYDSCGRNNKIKYQSLEIVIKYDKKTVTVTPPDKNAVTKIYNAHGELVSVTDAANGTVTYKYHCSGKPKQISSNGAIFSMTYDKYGRQPEPFRLYKQKQHSDARHGVLQQWQHQEKIRCQQ